MKKDIQSLDLIDIISERHGMLRKLSEKLWNDNSEIHITNSEWYIMSRIYNQQPTISHVSKNVDISRQATHKFIKKLEAKGLVEVMNVKHNNKEKCLRLTPLGKECYEKNESLKASLEKRITDRLGSEQIKILRNLLQSDWGLEME